MSLSLKVGLKPGRYLVAVSGGVDSITLLDLLLKQNQGCYFIVAHFDHGLRPVSAQDAGFVEQVARSHGLDFRLGQGKLEPNTSEAQARLARYQFLQQVRLDSQAQAIITAHHRDDVYETMIVNLSRKTGRRGLTSLRSRPGLLRPLINYTKEQLIDYAQAQHLTWREDASNLETKYFRNYLRLRVIPRLSSTNRHQLWEIYQQLLVINDQIDNQMGKWLKRKSYRQGGQVFNRQWFNQLPNLVAQEVVYFWLTETSVTNTNRNQIEYITTRLKTLVAGKKIVVGTNQTIDLTKRSIRLNL